MDYISNQTKSEITFKADIIEELAEELDIPKKELEELINLNIKYIKKSVLEKDYLIINLPNLCKLRFNYQLALSSSHINNNKNKSIKNKIEILREYKGKHKILPLNFKSPLFYRLWKKEKRRKDIKHVYRNMYSMIKEIEQKSNQIIKEITK